jgi:hypothetical protein
LRKISQFAVVLLFSVVGLGLARAAPCDPLNPSNNFCLTGVGNGANLDGIYVSPYTAIVNNVQTSVICDDFYNDVEMGESWSVSPAGGETVGSAATIGLFASKPNALVGYEEVAYLSQQLIQLMQNPSSLTPIQFQQQQDLLSYSIWAVFDPADVKAWLSPYTNPALNMGVTWATVSGELGSITSTDLAGDFSNVRIYTPSVPGTQTCPSCGAAQEFVVVTTPEAPTVANLAVDFLAFGALLFVFRRNLFATR